MSEAVVSARQPGAGVRGIGGVGTALWVIGLLGMVSLDLSHGTLRDEVVSRTVVWFVVAWVGWAALMFSFERQRGPSGGDGSSMWRWMIMAGLLGRLVMLVTEPTLSDDVYRYLWEGHLITQGVSPYEFAPGDAAAAAALDVDISVRQLVNNDSLASPYLPVAHAVFAMSAAVLPAEPWTMQLLMICFDVVGLFFLVRLLEFVGLPRFRAMLYWLNPLVIIEVGHGAHVDALIVALASGGLYFTLRARGGGQAHVLTAVGGPLLVGLATLTRPLALLFVVVLWWCWSWRQRVIWALTLVVPVAVVGVWSGFGLGSEGTGVFGSATEYTRTFRFNSGLYHWLEVWVAGRGLDDKGWNEPVALTRLIVALGVAVALGIVFLSARRAATARSALRLVSATLMVYVVATPVLHPWYLLLLLALVPFLTPADSEPAGRWIFAAPWLLLSGLVFFSYLTYQDPLAFAELSWVRKLEWYPTLGLVAASLAAFVMGWPSRRGTPRRAMIEL